MTDRIILNRRSFLKISATAAGGLLIATHFKTNVVSGDALETFTPNAFVRIDADDTITIWFKCSEIGQNVKTSMSVIIADELEANWNKVKVVQADLNPKLYGAQGSGGSDNITSQWEQLRQVGAMGREILIAAAAQTWSVPADNCVARNSEVIHQSSGRKLSYGALVGTAAKMPVPKTEPKLKDSKDFRLIGANLTGVDNLPIATGKPLFGIDVRVPGMLRASIERCPAFNGKVASVDSSKALAVPGVRNVIKIDGRDNPTEMMSGVAVVADSTWAAMKGREALSVTWDEGPVKSESTSGLLKQFRELSAKPGKVLRTSGDIDTAFNQSAKVLEAEYQAPFLAHVTMEPQNCVAHVHDGKCEIWGPLQSPGSARRLVSNMTEIPVENIHVHITRIGGGFGRRLMSDYAAEAAAVSRAVNAPVQVIWTREDDIQHDYYRPAGYHRVKAGLDQKGNISVWKHHLVNVSRNAYRKDPRPAELTEIYGLFTPKDSDLASNLEMDLVPVLIPNCRLEYTEVKTGIPTGAWRAPAHNVNAFVIETLLDELAHMARKDPVDLRLSILGDKVDFPFKPTADNPTPYNPSRMKAVLQLAAEKGGWGKTPPTGIGRGIAGHFTFSSYAAHVVDLSVDSKNNVKIHRVVSAVDTGITVSPSGIEAQTQSGIIDGISAAFWGGITVENGRVQESNFSDYRLMRIKEAPQIEVHILKNSERPSGEIALPPIAPAVANAIFAVTGKRIRQLPFRGAGFSM
ncbi:MAG TPA: molybdopterin cofactor-binding domain-containing protein [Blastocatellia bacterium]|nr:molybdopterin cofactor-binding domain-containing protein [Blastocatellia bacterium]